MTSKFRVNRRTEKQLIEALAVCLDNMSRGASLETCLEMYPALAGELRPLLSVSQAAQSLHPERIPPDAMNRSRTRALVRASELRARRKSLLSAFGGWRGLRVPRFVLSSVVTIIVFFAGFLSMNALASGSLPGDTLYPLKLSYENLWLALSNSQIHENLQTAYTERPIDEVRELIALGREEAVTFQGTLTSKELLSGIAPERWMVSDVFVLLMPDTEVNNNIEIGMLIEVEGHTRADGYVEADILRPLAFSFVGQVEEISSTIWRIGGQEVYIHPSTEIDPTIDLGDTVMVLVQFDDQGTTFARAIILMAASDDQPTETPVVSETPEPTPEVTATPSPTITSSPSPTSSPTLVPSDTPTLTETSISPTFIPPTAEPTDEPETEEPEDTPEPTETQDSNENDNDHDDDNENNNDNNNDNDNKED